MIRSKVSVVIPCRNEEIFLPRLLSALERQRGLCEMQYVCAISPDTIDRTRAIARRYDCTIVEGGRPATARNNGAAAAVHDTVLFLDADTYPEGEMYVCRALEEFSKRRLHVAGTLLEPDYQGGSFKKLVYNGLYRFLRYEFERRQNGVNPAMQSAMFFDRQAFFILGGFKEGLFREDSEIAARAVSNGHGYRFGILRKPGRLKNSVRRYEQQNLIRALLKAGYLNAKAELFGYESLENSIDAYLNGR